LTENKLTPNSYKSHKHAFLQAFYHFKTHFTLLLRKKYFFSNNDFNIIKNHKFENPFFVIQYQKPNPMKKLTIILTFFLATFLVQAQTTINQVVTNSSGGTGFLSGGGTVSWSVGEPVIGTISTASTTITQGFLQSYNIEQALKNLYLTLYLEGLFNGTSMNKAKNAGGDQYPGLVADQIAVELHNSATPYALAAGFYNVNVNTDGTASVTGIATTLNSNYYIVVKHRNSIETWITNPLSFAGATMEYNFSTAGTQAYGSNLKLVSGKYVIFGGDVNQDGSISAADLTTEGLSAASFATGYITTDVNGDGIVDALDLITTDNNAAKFVVLKKPGL
jgi:hypothetical protein